MIQINDEQKVFLKKHFVVCKKGEPVTVANSTDVPTTELRKTFDEKEMRRFFAHAKMKNRDEVQVVLKHDVEELLSNLEL